MTSDKTELSNRVMCDVDYDREEWRASVKDHPDGNRYLIVDAKTKDPRNGLLGTTAIEIQDYAFEPDHDLREELQVLVRSAIADIRDLYEAPL